MMDRSFWILTTVVLAIQMIFLSLVEMGLVSPPENPVVLYIPVIAMAVGLAVPYLFMGVVLVACGVFIAAMWMFYGVLRLWSDIGFWLEMRRIRRL